MLFELEVNSCKRCRHCFRYKNDIVLDHKLLNKMFATIKSYNNFKYDGTFNGSILVVGQTRCGKTSFVQKLGKNKMFGSIDSVDWISKIELSEAREHQIRESFFYGSVEFHYPNDLREFETILELLKDNKSDVNININAEADDLEIGEKDVFDRLIVMDDVSAVADKSNKFCGFLTVS